MSNMNFSKTGSLICELRKNRNMTQQQLASAIKVSKPAICQWESGSGIKTEELYNMAKFFNITVTELVEGKLKTESNADFWKRNYDLSNYNFDEMIEEKNLDDLKILFEHCNMVKKEFYRLLPSWANDTLKPSEKEEFYFLKENYFSFDKNYWAYLKYGPHHIGFPKECDEKEMVCNISYFDLSKEEYYWELSKLYSFTVDIKSQQVCESGNLKALEYMLSIMHPVEKDALLMHNLKREETETSDGFSKYKYQSYRDVTNDEIEQIPFYKVMLNSGCNCMLTYNNIGRETFDEEDFEKIEGEVKSYTPKINEDITNYGLFMNAGGQEEMSALKYWKCRSYKEYQSLIDHDRTQFLRDLVNYKDTNPLKYYERLLKTDGKSLGK